MHGATQKYRNQTLLAEGLWGVLFLFNSLSILSAQPAEPETPDRVAHEIYLEAKQLRSQQPLDPEASWRFGKACFDWAEFSTNGTQRASLANEGISACTKASDQNAELAGAYHYLAMNQGQLARTRGLAALKLVQHMESNFFKARALDEHFEQAAPDRYLGLLYSQAPGWPVSIGNRAKASTHLEKAVELAPVYPDNRINLMEAYVGWKQLDRAHVEMEKWNAVVAQAQKDFAGERWEWRWVSWNQRLSVLTKQLAKTSPDSGSPKAGS